MVVNMPSCLEGRVPETLCDKVMTAEDAAKKFHKLVGKKNISMGTSGFGSVGYPKRFPQALADILAGTPQKLIVLTGASAFAMDGYLAERNVLWRRYPYQNNPKMRKKIEAGEVHFMDYHLGEWPGLVKSGWLHRFMQRLDIAVVEASKVLENGFVPTASVGAVPAWV
jgi:acyl-CoA hydrolase